MHLILLQFDQEDLTKRFMSLCLTSMGGHRYLNFTWILFRRRPRLLPDNLPRWVLDLAGPRLRIWSTLQLQKQYIMGSKILRVTLIGAKLTSMTLSMRETESWWALKGSHWVCLTKSAFTQPFMSRGMLLYATTHKDQSDYIKQPL